MLMVSLPFGRSVGVLWYGGRVIRFRIHEIHVIVLHVSDTHIVRVNASYNCRCKAGGKEIDASHLNTW